METSDVIEAGGGLLGPAAEYGLRKPGHDTVMVDKENDILSAATDKFKIVWVQSKWIEMHRCHDWSRESARLYQIFPYALKEYSGLDLAHRNDGRMLLLLGKEELDHYRREIDILRQQADVNDFECKIIERQEVKKMPPNARLGKDVLGASLSIQDDDVKPLLGIVLGCIRQTDERIVQIGNMEVDVQFDDASTFSSNQRLVQRAVVTFPPPAGLCLVRTWGCIRVCTPDNCAIYDESDDFPGAFTATVQSGVTLAALNARKTAIWIAIAEISADFEEFSPKRFKVPEGHVPPYN